MDKTSRRGFLKILGKGSAVGAVLATPTAGYTIGIDRGVPGGDKTAFNFICVCDRSLIAEVPKNIGDTVHVKCDCGRTWRMRWEGDHFQTFDNESGGAYDERRQKMQAFADDDDLASLNIKRRS